MLNNAPRDELVPDSTQLVVSPPERWLPARAATVREWISERPHKQWLVRALIVLNIFFGTQYVLWRATSSVNWELWVLGLGLLLAEAFSYTDSLLFGMNMWHVRARTEAPAAPANVTVDVFITTYDEPIDLVRATAIAARDIQYPHQTWILDDGARSAMRAAAQEIGVGYLVRHTSWSGKKRHAKAGNLINALQLTSGEFLLVLDADQVPHPNILDRVLGWFRDPRVAFVQTPQHFRNIPPGDPFGNDAPLFYGPIQTGKDGWNSAFFCGSNAVLRREALMQAGVVWYARTLEARVRRACRQAGPLLSRARARLRRSGAPAGAIHAIDEVLGHVRDVRRALRAGQPLQRVTWRFQTRTREIAARLIREDARQMRLELSRVPGAGLLPLASFEAFVRGLTERQLSPLTAIAEVQSLVGGLDLDAPGEAVPVMPLSTVSVTEDMATAMRLHALGWRSVYHHEVLAVGLAPEDLRSALQQRLRWAQGTLQVLLRENPLFLRGLTLPQRLLYLGTMWSYLSGFAALVYLAAPVMYLLFGLTPVSAYSAQFIGYLLPWLITNQVLFIVIGWGLPTWRGQQYSLALFPVWITAVFTTIGNVYFGRHLGFVVTPKTRQHGPHLGLVWPQLVMMSLLAFSIAVGLVKLVLGWTAAPGPVAINIVWAGYDLAMLAVVWGAATWQPASDGQ